MPRPSARWSELLRGFGWRGRRGSGRHLHGERHGDAAPAVGAARLGAGNHEAEREGRSLKLFRLRHRLGLDAPLHLPSPRLLAPSPPRWAQAQAQTCPRPVGRGPCYKAGSPERDTLHGSSDSGRRIVLTGRVVDGRGRPVAGAWIDVWQADAAGRYETRASPTEVTSSPTPRAPPRELGRRQHRGKPKARRTAPGKLGAAGDAPGASASDGPASECRPSRPRRPISYPGS